jgi:hypothetical protein
MKRFAWTPAEIVASRSSSRDPAEERLASFRPLLSCIVNTLGITLVAVRGVELVEQDDGQVVTFLVSFAPEQKAS